MHVETGTHAPANSISGNIKAEMTAHMVEHPGCTREDLLQHFSPRQIDQYGAAAAREAHRRADRRAA